MFAEWQHDLLTILPVIICYETLPTHSKLWPMVWVSKRCVITQWNSRHSNWKEKKAKANTLCHIIVWLQSLKMWCGACECVNWYWVCRCWVLCCSSKLVETCPDEMSCLFMRVSLRRLTLFSLLPLCIRLLITVTLTADNLYAFKKLKYSSSLTLTCP